MPTVTIGSKLRDADGVTTGFDYLRTGLSIAVLAWHSVAISNASPALDAALWSNPLHFLPAAIIPAFFALSGFLVAGSLARNNLRSFLVLRAIRIVPALAFETTLSALVIGVAFTTLPLNEYLTSPHFYAYFLNMVGLIHYELPGAFENNVLPRNINAQLWTVPLELECYLVLTLLSITTVIRRPRLLVGMLAAASMAITVCLFLSAPVAEPTHVPGRMLIFCFLSAVGVFLYRDKIPYSNVLGCISIALSALCLEYPDANYLAAFPVAYMIVWFGLMRPRAIPFGDLSYGVFLFHFPIEQTIMHLVPSITHWWQLTLIALPVTGVVALLSWRLVEKPFLTHKKYILELVNTTL
jgi:peptidoglycan/LPS O-acetylase OafA/YrhL